MAGVVGVSPASVVTTKADIEVPGVIATRAARAEQQVAPVGSYNGIDFMIIGVDGCLEPFDFEILAVHMAGAVNIP
jgi:hypothetical protein